MRRLFSLFVACLCLGAPARAQDASPPVPATLLLAMRDRYALDSAQVEKLRDLETLQSAALAKTTAAFLRAEADVVETARGDDPGKRRAALETRARVAIDAEVARMKWEKDARAVLTAKQVAEVGPTFGSDTRQAMPWRDLVLPVSLGPPPPQVADSGELRISVTPNHADIYVNGVKRGSGRKALRLPVGMHEVEFTAVSCVPAAIRLEVVRQQATPFHQILTCGK